MFVYSWDLKLAPLVLVGSPFSGTQRVVGKRPSDHLIWHNGGKSYKSMKR